MEYIKQGYLENDFRLFHIVDNRRKEFDFHYHDFDKLLILIRGNVSYCIEGKTYALKPYDMVLVQHNEIHKPIIHTDEPYERIIVYISPGYLHLQKTAEYDLSYCFQRAVDEHAHVLRLSAPKSNPVFHAIKKLENSFQDEQYAAELYRHLLFLEFMVHLNRAVIAQNLDYIHETVSNPKVQHIIRYIHEYLTTDLTIDRIAKETFMSRYHMMRTFKSETGYTIHEYINQKRLVYAKELLLNNMTVTQVCYECGFKDYSSFLRAYKKQFGELPKNTYSNS